MRSIRRPFTALTAMVLLATVPATAAVFTVHLKNGNSFDTRYRPRVAEWDESKVVLLTDFGNRITLLQDDIVDITSDTEVRGFGTVIDTTTIVLGWAPNDAPVQGEPDATQQWMDYLGQIGGSRRNFSVEQFVEPSEAGQGGLPSWEFGPGAYDAGNQPVVVPMTAPSGPPPGGGGQ